MTESRVIVRDAPEGLSREHAPANLRLTLIGQMEAATADGSNVLPLGRKTRALLAILALSAPRPVVRARLADLLWSKRHEEQARASLRQEIHRLLDSLQPAGPDILTVTRDHVMLRLGAVWMDVEEVLRATPADPSRLDLLKGKLLDEFDGIDPAFDVWLAAERERLQDRARSVGEELLRQQNEPDAMITIAQRLLSIDRAHEGAWRALMGAYAARGDRGMAVQAYERCRVVLKEKLDAAPSPETQRLLAGIRGGTSGVVMRSEAAAPEPAPPQRSIMRLGVLPLQLLGTDPVDAHVALCIAEDITAALSAFRSIAPISSSSLQQHGSRDESTLHRAFGLNYLVDGSIQRAADRLRITVRLLDLEDGNRVAWVHRFDRDRSDLLLLQDEVTAEVTGQIYGKILELEYQRAAARPLATATADDLLLRAIPLFSRLRRDEFDEAGAMISRALSIEPNLAAAHAMRAYWLVLLASQGWATELDAVRREAGEHAERAVSLDSQDARNFAVAGHVRAYLHRQPREAMELHERSLALNPHLSLAVGLSAMTLVYIGDVEGATQRFAELHATGPSSLYYEASLALLEILRRNEVAAIRLARRSSELNANLTSTLKHYLAALGHAGLHTESRAVLRRLMAAEPNFTIQSLVQLCPLGRPADVVHYAAGLRLAGVPEGRAPVV